MVHFAWQDWVRIFTDARNCALVVRKGACFFMIIVGFIGDSFFSGFYRECKCKHRIIIDITQYYL